MELTIDLLRPQLFLFLNFPVGQLETVHHKQPKDFQIGGFLIARYDIDPSVHCRHPLA